MEDNPLNREIAEDMLVEDGFKVDTADNGKKALQMIVRSDPWYYSAVLMDIQMPVMDGYASAAAIRRLDREDAGSIPIIAMIANSMDQDENRISEAGIDASISKPLEIRTLQSQLWRISNKKDRAFADTGDGHPGQG